MPTLADSLVSSSARVLPMRMRADLTAKQQRYQGRPYWVVKEPVGLNYYRFQEEEYAILNMIDGHSSLDDLKERFEDEFPPQKITVEELGQFVGMLHRSGLVIADVPGQGRQLKKRRDERKRKELLGALSNILAIRFKGIDPDRLLNWLHPKFRWMFRTGTVVCCLLFALSALMLVAVNFDTFQRSLPSFHQFFGANNWFYLGATLAVTKIIHEFGHGLSCKHFGGECHEMGVMLLVLTPCLYCNVSDSWMLPNKWHRAWIGAAGMYVELIIAATCTWIWWFTRTNPGLLNNLCLSTMFVCSVSTLMFNANPLLRYDGYYILSDLTEIPNLRQKASSILNRKLGAWCLGLEEPEDPFLPQRNQVFFAIYSVAAAIYRWVVLFSILWFLYQVLEPYRLKVVSQLLATVSVAGLVVQPLWKLGKFFYVPGRVEQVKHRRLYATLAILAAVAAFVFFVPLPYHVMCNLEIKPRDAHSVYVTVPGRLENVHVASGQLVKKDQVLAELKNEDLELAIADLEAQATEHMSSLTSLQRIRQADAAAGNEIPQVQELLAAVREQLRQKQLDRDRLALKSPAGGTVLPPPETPQRPDTTGELQTWHGLPMDKRNLGAHFNESVLFCSIGDPRKMEASIVIDQDDIEYVRRGQHVEIKLEELPNRTYQSEIIEIGPEYKVVSRQLTNKTGGELATRTDEAGLERPMNPSYPARAPLDDDEGLLFIGLRGKAKVAAQWQTLGQRGWRLFLRTFNFKL